MPVEFYEKSRRHRLAMMFLLIVFAALAGYHWGSIFDNARERIYQHDVIIGAVAFTLLSLLVAMWSEVLAGKIEQALESAHDERQQQADDARHHQKQVRELERIVDRLAQDNSTVRYELLSNAVRETAEAVNQAGQRWTSGAEAQRPELTVAAVREVAARHSQLA